jgi:hypothetical protein
LLEATARRVANFAMNWTVVRADNSLRFVAPEMAGQFMRGHVRLQGFFHRRHGEHFLCPQMFANGEIGHAFVHGVILSI